MTVSPPRLSPEPVAASRGRGRAWEVRGARARLVFRWEFGEAGSGGEGQLGITVRRGVARAEVRWVKSDGRPALVRSGRVAVAHDSGAGLAHVDAPGVLAATIRLERGRPPRLLYARTPLLAELGVPGGRAEAPVLVDKG